MRLKHYFIIFFLCLIVSGCLLFIATNTHSQGRGKEEIPARGGIYRRPLESNPRTFDPALATDIYSVTVIQQIFDGLVQFDKDLNVIPALARSWKISPDGLSYTFFLREGAQFHNGREVTAQDFVYSFSRILDPEIRSSASDFFTRVLGAREFMDRKSSEVKGLIVKDKYTFDIILSEPYTPFISILAMKGAKVVPKEEVEKRGGNFAKSPVGTGPFRFVSMKEGEEILLEANPDYFEGRPHLDRLIFRIFHGVPRKEMLKVFMDGNIEESFIPPDELENVIRSRRYLFFQKPTLSLRFYGFNAKAKPLENKKLRKAISYAINKKSVVSEIHKNQFSVANGILPPGMPGFSPREEFYPHNETQAKRFLMEAGYREGQAMPTLEIWSGTRSEAAQKELNEIVSQLKKIGITANLNFETNWPSYESLLRTNKAAVFIYAWYADFPDPEHFLGTLFHSQSKYNYAAYQNPQVDRLLEKAKTERDYLKRMEMYRKIEEIILEDAPLVPMVNHLFQMVCQPYVRGIEVNALGGPYVPIKKVWFKKD